MVPRRPGKGLIPAVSLGGLNEADGCDGVKGWAEIL